MRTRLDFTGRRPESGKGDSKRDGSRPTGEQLKFIHRTDWTLAGFALDFSGKREIRMPQNQGLTTFTHWALPAILIELTNSFFAIPEKSRMTAHHSTGKVLRLAKATKRDG